MKKIFPLLLSQLLLVSSLLASSYKFDNPPSDTDPLPQENQSETFTVNGVSFNMMLVKAGAFTMGATPEQQDPGYAEKPAHSVTLTHDYYIGETEVTQALWQAVMGSNPSYYKGDDLPVEQVSWDECQKFIGRLNELTGRVFRLPTEAEWEFAARGGNNSRGYQYAGGNNLSEVAWYRDNSGKKPHPVKTRRPNELGLYDMSGNVCERCQDWFGDYSSELQTDPAGPADASWRVFRGGSWNSLAWGCRIASRDNSFPDYRDSNLGLRLALSE